MTIKKITKYGKIYGIIVRNQKGMSALVIFLTGAIVAVSAFLTVNLVSKKSSSPSETDTLTDRSTETPTSLPTSTPIASPYTVEAEFICSSGGKGNTSRNHVDLSYNFSTSMELNSSPNVITITDTKTKTIFELGRTEVINQEALMHSSVKNSDGNIMPFVADGRTYILKQYKLSTTTQAITKDLQPVSEKSFSKTCSY